jgi:hypothetical protein
VYHFPIESYVRSLHGRPDVARHLLLDYGERPEGHISRSHGFKEKVTDNDDINGDHRNLALIGTADGVPYFDDQRRGAWPFILRCANLPDGVFPNPYITHTINRFTLKTFQTFLGMSMHPSNIHLHLISANEYWELDTGSNCLRRKIHAPKSLNPHLSIVTDDLLGFYWHGIYLPICVTNVYPSVSGWYPCVPMCAPVCVPIGVRTVPICTHVCTCVSIGFRTVDSTRSLDDNGRVFVCKGILLNWNGDYPAQTKCAGTHDKVCHWCSYKSEPAPEINRRKWASFRRWLPAQHPYRTDGRFGPTESQRPPEHRTHQGYIDDGTAQQEHVKARRPKTSAPYKTTGTFLYTSVHMSTYISYLCNGRGRP